MRPCLLTFRNQRRPPFGLQWLQRKPSEDFFANKPVFVRIRPHHEYSEQFFRSKNRRGFDISGIFPEKWWSGKEWPEKLTIESTGNPSGGCGGGGASLLSVIQLNSLFREKGSDRVWEKLKRVHQRNFEPPVLKQKQCFLGQVRACDWSNTHTLSDALRPFFCIAPWQAHENLGEQWCHIYAEVFLKVSERCAFLWTFERFFRPEYLGLLIFLKL